MIMFMGKLNIYRFNITYISVPKYVAIHSLGP